MIRLIEGNEVDVIRCEGWAIVRINKKTVHEGIDIPDTLWIDLMRMSIAKVTRKFIKIEDMEEGNY